MTDAVLIFTITGLVIASLYVIAFLAVWRGAHLIEQLKRKDPEDWEA